MQNIYEGLNSSQMEAVTTTEGFIRVIAGAGSGKTRALTHRYAYLVNELGIPSQNILCLTFTNKAAKEMKTRVKKLLGADYDTSFVATIHSFCTRVLREDIGRLFYPESFIIMDNSDQKNILEEVYEELGIKMDTATFAFIIDQIRYEKNLAYYMDYMAVPDRQISEIETEDTKLKVIYRYMEKQKKYFGLDFFDLINFTIYLFRKHDDILEKWQKRLHYVMIDEFQDVTMKEFKFIRTLTDLRQNYFVVGDPDQNIYEWRGSKMEVLLEFEENIRGYYDGTIPSYFENHVIPPLAGGFTTIFLNQNYRSTPEVLRASNDLVGKNKNRIEKDLFPTKAEGAAVEHFHGRNDAEEIAYIKGKIGDHLESGGRYSDIAVLYRSNHVSRFIEQGFLKHNIPYMVYGGVGFFERMEIKDVLSYMRLVAYGDDLSFKRIINVPRRQFGKTKLKRLAELADREGLTLYECLKAHIGEAAFSRSGAPEFVEVIEAMREQADKLPVSELLQKLLIDTKYEMYIRESGDMERLDNIAELLRSIVQAQTDWGEHLPLATYLQEVSLHGDTDKEDAKEGVRIMTIHTSKGLEFPHVFVVGMSEGTFPSARALEERKDAALEEERRLCFVAMTRAKERLYMSESEGMGFKGWSKTPSRFLFDIEEESIKRVGEIPAHIIEEMRRRIGLVKPSGEAGSYVVGSQVKHKVFGEGVVEEIDEVGRTYTVRFMAGVKPISFDYQGLSQVF